MILVTGATGHIGNVLVRALCARGESVRALLLPDDDPAPLAGLDVMYVTGNVLDPDSLKQAMHGVDLVYHLAGVISILPSHNELMWRVNVEGAHNVAQAALEVGVHRLVHVSSIHAFQTQPQGALIDETAPLALDAPRNSYNRTKAEGTLRVLEVVHKGLNAVIVCPTGIIGPHDYRHSEMGTLVQDFARRKLHVLVDGAYDFVDVRDVVKGMMGAAAQGRRGELYILSGYNISLTHLRHIVQDLVGIHTPALVIPFGVARAVARLMDHLYPWMKVTPRFTSYSLNTVRENILFSHQKASQTFAYHPRPLRQTLRDVLEWRQQRLQRAPLPV
ncbi:MAG: NAD-dependent epimerase/dehydratase family protein [Anaerolineae bacterium]